MGQYFNPIIKEGNGRLVAFNRHVIENGIETRTPAKLTEHSWFLNDFVNAICEKIYLSPKTFRVIWMGDYARDYANEPEKTNNLPKQKLFSYYQKCWQKDAIRHTVYTTEFTLFDLFLVNHTKKVFFDCNAYFQNSVMKTKRNGDWCMHPLPILTCIGNGLGGGDYTHHKLGSTTELIGTWAWDEIDICDNLVDGYTEILPIFQEEGWEE